MSGGLAVAQFGKTDCHAMPGTQGDLLELIGSIKSAADVEGAALVCVLEEVSGFAGQAQPGSAMFKFGEHYGFIKGVVQTLGIRLVLVRPQAWQKGFGLGTASNCTSKGQWKNKLKAEAQRRFPRLPVTLKTADALLILDWFLRGGPSRTGDERAGAREVAGESPATTGGSGGGGGGGWGRAPPPPRQAGRLFHPDRKAAAMAKGE